MKPTPPRPRWFVLPLLTAALLLPPALATAQIGNGKLQIHHIDVGQADGILVVSPQGQLAIVDNAAYNNCAPFMSYITGLGVTDFDYSFASHYHADHIGCLDDLLAAGVVLNIAGYDRGYSYSSATYTNYVNALGTKRQTIAANQTVTLDAGSANPVVIRCVALNGAGVYSPTGTDENAKSVVLKVSYGAFDEVLGGDLTGDPDVESAVGPLVGDVEVYKVHHHGSATSSYDAWLAATTPEVGVICVGDNSYGHPTAAALTRLHSHGVKTYWTEIGSGASPTSGWDYVGGTIVVQADPADGAAYTVAGDGFTHTYYSSGGGGGVPVEKTYYPTSVTALIGTFSSGSYANLAANDASYLRVTAGKSGTKYYTDWYASATVAETPTSFTVKYDGKYSAKGTQTLYLYNFSSGSWSQIDAYTVGTTDVTRTCEIASPAAYVSASGEIRVRVARASATKSYYCYGDYLPVIITYTGDALLAMSDGAGDGPAAGAAGAAGADALGAPRDAPPPAVQAFMAWPNPFNPLVQISFELDQPASGRLAVYDVSGRQVAVLANGRLESGRNVYVWNGANARGEALSSGVYIAHLETAGESQTLKLVLMR